MRDDVALRRYLQRHIEPGLPNHPFTQPHWHQVLVLPAYRETPALLDHLTRLPASSGRSLVILVLNRPDSDDDPSANGALRGALAGSTLPQATRGQVPVYCLNPCADLYLYDMELLRGVTPRSLGVGLARKAGCDLALQWMAAGGISGQWLCSTDADAILPSQYFEQLDQAAPSAVAAVFPFRHLADADQACNEATALYELRLHHYVLGLEYAGSPYAFHTLGSCLAIRYGAYTHVHGFPKRAGAEDFYLLNKLAKLGPVARLHGRCIELQARRSSRVPFGTGPAVSAIMGSDVPSDTALFYPPQCFAALAALLALLPALADAPDLDIPAYLSASDRDGQVRISPVLARQAHAALGTLDIASALAHCHRQSSSSAQFIRHFHQWFDGFRTLKFIHALRDGGLPLCSLAELSGLVPQLWPDETAVPQEVAPLQHAIRRHWRWQ